MGDASQTPAPASFVGHPAPRGGDEEGQCHGMRFGHPTQLVGGDEEGRWQCYAVRFEASPGGSAGRGHALQLLGEHGDA